MEASHGGGNEGLETKLDVMFVGLLEGRKVIGFKWMFKKNFLWFNGYVELYKACLVAKGYSQVEGVD